MTSNDTVKSALVGYLKTVSAIVNELPSGSSEIREHQWQGTEFTYPNIRVRVISNVPMNVSCDATMVTGGIQVFSEDASSAQADHIAGIINTTLHKRSFSYGGIKMNLYVTNLVPAIRIDNRTWRSEILFRATVS